MLECWNYKTRNAGIKTNTGMLECWNEEKCWDESLRDGWLDD